MVKVKICDGKEIDNWEIDSIKRRIRLFFDSMNNFKFCLMEKNLGALNCPRCCGSNTYHSKENFSKCNDCYFEFYEVE